MLALRKIGPTKEGMVLQEVPEPECGPDEILVEVRCVGICGSDLHIWKDEKEHKEPVTLGQIELTRFQNPQGLKSIGGNLFEQTNSSGEPIIGTPAKGGFGKIIQGFLENSNVDMAEEQVNLIIDQRSFQANANIIKTADEMMKTTIDIKK